jgi:TonB family protein
MTRSRSLLATTAGLVLSLTAVKAGAQVPVYPNTLPGLQQQIADVVEAERQHNSPRVELLVQNLLVPDIEQWADANLPRQFRNELVAKYGTTSKAFEASILAQAERVGSSPDASVAVTNYPIPAGVPADTRDLITAAAASPYRIEFSGGRLDSKPMLESFLYYKDAFRFVGQGIFPFWVPVPHGFTSEGKRHTAPRAISAPSPTYPDQARKDKIQGTVVISLTVGADGLPHDLVVKNGNPALTAAALEAVNRWKFKPAEVDGRPVDVHIDVEVNFRFY